MIKKTTNFKFRFLALPVLLLGLFVFFFTTKKLPQVLACPTQEFSGLIEENEKIAIFEGKNVKIPTIAENLKPVSRVLGSQSPQNKWIDVDLSDQKLKAWEGDNLFLETPISSGLPWTPTPVGRYKVWAKLRFTRMEGGEGKYYYNLPNVPFVMFFQNEDVPGWKGYGLHGTYWHNDFGHPRSHGCVNLPTPVAEKLYYWVGPVLPEKKSVVFASEDNLGTLIVIHD